jgi:hypothetical protein
MEYREVGTSRTNSKRFPSEALLAPDSCAIAVKDSYGATLIK